MSAEVRTKSVWAGGCSHRGISITPIPRSPRAAERIAQRFHFPLGAGLFWPSANSGFGMYAVPRFLWSASDCFSASRLLGSGAISRRRSPGFSFCGCGSTIVSVHDKHAVISPPSIRPIRGRLEFLGRIANRFLLSHKKRDTQTRTAKTELLLETSRERVY